MTDKTYAQTIEIKNIYITKLLILCQSNTFDHKDGCFLSSLSLLTLFAPSPYPMPTKRHIEFIRSFWSKNAKSSSLFYSESPSQQTDDV
jgi:hypothetical protein